MSASVDKQNSSVAFSLCQTDFLLRERGCKMIFLSSSFVQLQRLTCQTRFSGHADQLLNCMRDRLCAHVLLYPLRVPFHIRWITFSKEINLGGHTEDWDKHKQGGVYIFFILFGRVESSPKYFAPVFQHICLKIVGAKE